MAESTPALIRTTGALFVVGSALFALGVLLQLPSHWPALVGGLSYAVGAVFFTTAAWCQTLLARRELPAGARSWFPWRARSSDLVAALVQLVGTVLFNVDTIDYCLTLDARAAVQDVAVWVPDSVGSLAFLVSSVVALAPEVRERRHAHLRGSAFWEWRSAWIAGLNLLGSILFGVSAVASFEPDDGVALSPWWTNAGTFLGAVCFLVAAWLFAAPRGVRMRG